MPEILARRTPPRAARVPRRTRREIRPGRAAAALLIAVLAASSAGAQPPGEFSLEDLVRAADGRLAVCARHLGSGAEIALNADRRYPDGALDRLGLALACREISGQTVRASDLRQQVAAWLTHGDPAARRDLATWCGWSGRSPRVESSPRELVQELQQLASDPAADATGLRDILRGLSPVSVARDLPFHLPVLGLDSSLPGGAVASGALIETPGGGIAVAVIASGYADPGTACDLVARMGRVALGRLAPRALEEPAAVDPLQLRGFHEALLTDRREAAGLATAGAAVLERSLSESRRSLFRILEGAAAVLTIETDTARHVGVRWTLPDGTRQRIRETIPARQRGATSWSLDLKQLGAYRVELALDGHRVLDEIFQVTTTAPKKP